MSGYWPPSSLPATSKVQCSDTPQEAREASFSSGHPASNSTWSSTRRPSRAWTWDWKSKNRQNLIISHWSFETEIITNIFAVLQSLPCFPQHEDTLPWSVQQSPHRSPQGCGCSGNAKRVASCCWKKTKCSTLVIMRKSVCGSGFICDSKHRQQARRVFCMSKYNYTFKVCAVKILTPWKLKRTSWSIVPGTRALLCLGI